MPNLNAPVPGGQPGAATNVHTDPHLDGNGHAGNGKPSANGNTVHAKGRGVLALWRPWNERSKELAVWAIKRMVNRRDRHGRYYIDRDGKIAVFTTGDLTDATILRHFRAKVVGDIIGLLATAYHPMEGTGRGVSLSRWLRLDIDHHGEGAEPDANLVAALAWHERLAGLGFHPLLAESNGRGGYWLDVIFDDTVLTSHVRRFGLWLSLDWRELGLSGPPEVFPKQFEVKADGPGECGSWARLYGRHHSGDHWTRVYDDGEWLEGAEAIETILDVGGDPASLIPSDALEFGRDRKAERVERAARPRTEAQLEGDAALAKEALGYLGKGKRDSRGREFLSDYDHWLRIGFALHELGDVGFDLWSEWSSQCEEKYDEEVCVYKWGTMSDDGQDPIRLGTLFRYATQMGRKGPWRPETDDDEKPPSEYICGRSREPISCPNNTKIWLGLNRAEDHVRYDRFRQAVLLGESPLTDQAVIDLTMEIEASLRVPWSQDHVRSALVHLAHQRPFSSVVEWLESLEWDEIERINKFFPDHYESEDTEYSRECARVFFLSAVARAFKPGCQADIMPVLIGPQGIGKSTGMAALCPNPDWFADDLGCDLFAGKAAEGLQGKWIFEFGEFARINRSTLDVVKSFITRRVDRYRPPYGRIAQDFPRSCVFFGTTNIQQPLQDIENRRFFPLKVIQGDVAAISSARDQLWAEAVHRYKGGEKWYITSSHLLEKVSSHVESARSEDAWEAILREKLAGSDRTTMVEAAQLLGLWDDRSQVIVNKLGKPEQTRIGLALAAIGFERKRDTLPPRSYFYARETRPTLPESFRGGTR